MKGEITGAAGDARSANRRGDGDGRHSHVKRSIGKVIDGVPVAEAEKHIEAMLRCGTKTQSTLVCVSCGHAENADINALGDIASTAVVNQPIESSFSNRYNPIAFRQLH
ncbi:MAG: hypothetical protein ABSB81_06635 [Halobacteriota archaeon]|jgi:hypothetical protein